MGEFPLIPEDAQTWQRLSMFGARCLGAGQVAAPFAEAMDALRAALEEDLSELPAMAVVECRVLVTCGWLSPGARRLLEWARENRDYTNVPMDGTTHYVEQGPLYQGPACMCLERWHFWLGRLDELASEECAMSDAIPCLRQRRLYGQSRGKGRPEGLLTNLLDTTSLGTVPRIRGDMWEVRAKGHGHLVLSVVHI